MPATHALSALVFLAGAATNAVKPMTPATAEVGCAVVAVDTLKQQATHLVTGKLKAVKDDGGGTKLAVIAVDKSWKGAAKGSELSVRQDPDAAGEAGSKSLEWKVGGEYFIAAGAPIVGQKFSNLIEVCGSSAPLAKAEKITWELENGPIEEAPRAAVLPLFASADGDVRLRAINRVAEFKDNDTEVYAMLRERALKDPEATVRVAAGRQIALGAVGQKVEFKVIVAMLAVNDGDVGPELCHAFLESAPAKSKIRLKVVSALHKVIINKKEKGKKPKAPEAWNAQHALDCLEGHEGGKQKDAGEYEDAWGK